MKYLNKSFNFFPNTSKAYECNYKKIFRKSIKHILGVWFEEFLYRLFIK